MNAPVPVPASDHDRLRAELAALLPAPEVPDLPLQRHQALRRTVLTTAQAPARPAAARRRTGPRAVAVPRLALGAVLAGAVALVLVAGTGGPPVPTVPRHDGAAGTHGRPPAATGVLTRAALAASAASRTEARPHEFVYIDSLVAHAARSAAGGGPPSLPPAHRRQVWLSADGTRPGLLREAGAPDTSLDEPGRVYELDRRGATPRPGTLTPAEPSVTRPTHAYVAALPTDPEALLSLIRTQTRATAEGDPDQRAFTAIGTLLAETWAPPRVTAALYQAAARIPGTTVLPSATDAAGREGVAVARTGVHGEQNQWIFDRATAAFLGERTVLTRSTDAGPAGAVLGTTAVLARDVTARPGETPAKGRP